MIKNLFQYGTTTDPTVLAAIAERENARADLHRRAVEFSARYGTTDGGYYRYDFGSISSVLAVAGDKPVGHGAWKKGRRGWIPYKNNPVHEEFAKLRTTPIHVPGVPEVLFGAHLSNGSQHMYSPHPFAHDGAAWVGTGGAPTDDSNDEYGPQWSECLASEFHRALEGYNAARKEAAK